jgi:hypothetical protein
MGPVEYLCGGVCGDARDEPSDTICIDNRRCSPPPLFLQRYARVRSYSSSTQLPAKEYYIDTHLPLYLCGDSTQSPNSASAAALSTRSYPPFWHSPTTCLPNRTSEPNARSSFPLLRWACPPYCLGTSMESEPDAQSRCQRAPGDRHLVAPLLHYADDSDRPNLAGSAQTPTWKDLARTADLEGSGKGTHGQGPS